MRGDSAYAYAQQLVAAYFHMITVGCGLPRCANPRCASAAAAAAPSPADAAIQSVYWARIASIPLCAPILARFGLLEHDKSDREECPEAEDDVLLCSMPRRRLSSAVELALAFTRRSQDDAAQEGDDHCEQQPRAQARRRLSLPKQKLLDALTWALDRAPSSSARR